MVFSPYENVIKKSQRTPYALQFLNNLKLMAGISFSGTA